MVEVWISGRPPGAADTPPSVVSLFKGCPRPWSTSAWMKDEDVVVLLMSLVRDLSVVVVGLYEEILLPPFVSALLDVGAVVLTPPFVLSKLSSESGLIPPGAPSVFALEYTGVLEVEIKPSLVVAVE